MILMVLLQMVLMQLLMQPFLSIKIKHKVVLLQMVLQCAICSVASITQTRHNVTLVIQLCINCSRIHFQACTPKNPVISVDAGACAFEAAWTHADMGDVRS